MAKYRVAIVEWTTVFGEKVLSPSPQVRVGFFWWVTLTHCESVKQALIYIENVKKRKKEIVHRVVA